jgi:hypothetical protein
VIPRFHLGVSSSLVVSAVCAGGCLAQATMRVATEVPAAPGWQAHVIHEADSGVWYAHIDKAIDFYGPNEILAADDKGRFLLLTVYSGQWTAHSCTPDGLWLAPSHSADVDPRVPGREMYAGGRAGSIHRIVVRPQPFAKFTLETDEIGHVAGEEFHTVLASDLLPEHPNAELLAFAISGAVYRLEPEGPDRAFSITKIADLGGRVRDALIVPATPKDTAPSILGVSRAGDLLSMKLTARGLTHRVLLHEDCGLGRIALSPTVPGVGYITRDDGLLVRFEIGANESVARQPMLATSQGLRGVAAGRFYSDGREAVACYGYGKIVQMVTRNHDGSFATEDLYTGEQKGHWLVAGELDGRNGTDELLATGFDGVMVLLSREPGYGLPGVAVPAKKNTAVSLPAAPLPAAESAAAPSGASGDIPPTPPAPASNSPKR